MHGNRRGLTGLDKCRNHTTGLQVPLLNRKRIETMNAYADVAGTLQESLDLALPPIAICISDTVPEGIPLYEGSAPAAPIWTRSPMTSPSGPFQEAKSSATPHGLPPWPGPTASWANSTGCGAKTWRPASNPPSPNPSPVSKADTDIDAHENLDFFFRIR